MTETAERPPGDDRGQQPVVPDLEAGRDVPLAEFGERFMRLVLPKSRVLDCVNQVLGETIALGPFGAGPGRVFATITAAGTYGKSYGEELDDEPGYRVLVPISLTFDLDLSVDSMSFHADVLLPLRVSMHVEDPLTIVLVITPPSEKEVGLEVATDNRRSAISQRMAGINGELRRFIVKFVTRELAKPYVVKACRIDLPQVIGVAWPVITAQFLPQSPADRS